MPLKCWFRRRRMHTEERNVSEQTRKHEMNLSRWSMLTNKQHATVLKLATVTSFYTSRQIFAEICTHSRHTVESFSPQVDINSHLRSGAVTVCVGTDFKRVQRAGFNQQQRPQQVSGLSKVCTQSCVYTLNFFSTLLSFTCTHLSGRSVAAI